MYKSICRSLPHTNQVPGCVIPALSTKLSSPARELHSSATVSGQERVIVFSGIQPTGIPHLGNYLGTLRRWVEIQNAVSTRHDCIYCIADLHAVTSQRPEKLLRLQRRQTLAALLAIGISPDSSTLFYQSDVWV